MCKPDNPSVDCSEMTSSPPPSVQAYGSDGSESDEAARHDPKDSPANKSLFSAVGHGILHGVGWCLFALYFTLLISSQEVREQIYPKAHYVYDPALSHFDHTIWTYGTDYALATITGAFAVWILHTSHRSNRDVHKRLARVSATMLVLYSISTLAGAIAHQNMHTIEWRNTWAFRLLWTTCVGTVFLAPAAMGMIGNECLRIFQPRKNCPAMLQSMPCLSDAFWMAYAAVGTIGCALGVMSFQRPACDIFIAGGTQTPCTFYCMGFIYLVEHPGLSKAMRWGGLIGFIMNAAMLPAYPYLILDLGWSLPATNTLMHTNLCVAWSLQGLVLQRIVKSVVEEDPAAVNPQQQQLRTKKVQ